MAKGTSETLLSSVYQRMTDEEWRKLSMHQHMVLGTFEEQEWEHGALFAWIENIRRVVDKTETISRSRLAEYLGISTSAVTHLFETGQITASHFCKLMRAEWFVGTEPGEDEVAVHEQRAQIGWIRKHVVRDGNRSLGPKWGEFVLLHLAHRLECDDCREAFDGIPRDLLESYFVDKRKWSAGKLLDLMSDWGKSYRFLARLRSELHERQE